MWVPASNHVILNLHSFVLLVDLFTGFSFPSFLCNLLRSLRARSCSHSLSLSIAHFSCFFPILIAAAVV